MSFQGDVGGIGLADLLQSLARGREGVLTLLGRDGTKSTLGVQGGLLHLLPDPDEDPESWRNRVRQAWVKDPDFRIDSLRMVEIARAQRIEDLYRLLDSDNVHFRFAPGPLPAGPSESPISASEPGTERKGPRRDGVHVGGAPVEGLLLEYARLKDEAQSAGVDWVLSDDEIPIRLDGEGAPRDFAKLHGEIDGTSSVIEVSDRLGWTARQTRLALLAELRRGALRLAGHEELVERAQSEIAHGCAERGASRLRAWLACAPPGPLPEVEAQIFQSEWEAGRLQPVLRLLAARDARTFVLRLDAALGVPLAALDHWTELCRQRGDDRAARIRLVQVQALTSADPNVPAVRDLLAMARAFLDQQRAIAARACLRIAAARAPEATNVRLEIGAGLIAAGSVAEGGPWILEAVTTLFEAGDHEKALPPLRALVEVDPQNREARRLLGRARAHAVQRTLVKKNSLVTIAVVAALSFGAVVQYRSAREHDAKVEAVTSHMDDPREALRILEAEFPGDEADSVRELKATLLEKKKVGEAAVRTAWTDRYREAQLECTVGDPLLGLRRALEMPSPPLLAAGDEPLPLASDLYNGLAARIETQFKELGAKVEDAPLQVHAETRLKSLIAELRGPLADVTSKADAREFDRRLQAFAERIDERQELRASERQTRLQQADLARQDLLLAAARAHAQAGDYRRSRAKYRELVESDATGKLATLFAREIQEVEAKSTSIARARELATQGRHAEAKQVLVAAKLPLEEYLLPFKVTSFPSGARARLENGTERVTPFTLESAFGERLSMTLELDGHEPNALSIDAPGDHHLLFSRLAERSWPTAGRVEALPVAVGEDHVVCDRSGGIARLARGGRLVWVAKLPSLGGVGRAPVFMPRNPGRLLLVSEDGEAFVVSAADGAIEGPFAEGTPPTEGPVAVEDGVRARFRDGVVLEWKSRLKPEPLALEATEPLADEASSNPGANAAEDARETNGLSVLRRRSGPRTTLASPWTEIAVEVGANAYTVRAPGARDPLFVVRRAGDWTYVAWEAPRTLIPRGRLWISDGHGLRSFVP